MAPVMHNGYWLVDGAVVNPVPVSLTRAGGGYRDCRRLAARCAPDAAGFVVN
jgi:hypothetical protein